MNVNLTSQLEDFIHSKVKSGLYNSASEVVRDALRLLEEQDRIKELKLQLLREEIQKGLRDLDEGKHSTLTIEEVKRRAREKAEADRTL